MLWPMRRMATMPKHERDRAAGPERGSATLTGRHVREPPPTTTLRARSSGEPATAGAQRADVGVHEPTSYNAAAPPLWLGDVGVADEGVGVEDVNVGGRDVEVTGHEQVTVAHPVEVMTGQGAEDSSLNSQCQWSSVQPWEM